MLITSAFLIVIFCDKDIEEFVKDRFNIGEVGILC